MTPASQIGFMQGRLSPLVEGRIQAFPWTSWRDEFPTAARLGFGLMEWTLDQERLYENPLMTEAGRTEIKALSGRWNVRIPALTGDCFMQAPFWKAIGSDRVRLERNFLDIVEACADVGIGMIVVPLVDNGSIRSRVQEDALVEFLTSNAPTFRARRVNVIMECDFVPDELARLIGRLDADVFGINYDIGNSASLRLNAEQEGSAYGSRIMNVHVKDRVAGGTTVPLGTGSANFDLVFSMLAKIGYGGNYILQTARAADGNHADVLGRYRDMTLGWLSRCAA